MANANPVILPCETAVLRLGRKYFPAFYASASEVEAAVMDGLLVAHASLVLGGTGVVRRVFVELRGAVRSCPTFAALPAGERGRIERTLLQGWPPLS